jgi:hypothetical protein
MQRLNHACRPSTSYTFNPTTLSHTVLALRTIPPNEEITLSYIPQLLPRSERHALLKKGWGFECDCTLCSATSEGVEESDAKVWRIGELKSELLDDLGFEDEREEVEERKEKVIELVELYEEEGLLGPVYEAYQIAAKVFHDVGAFVGAERYARLALEVGVLFRGEAHVDVVEMKSLLEDLGKRMDIKVE